MILAYAGRRAQSLAGDPEQVAERIRRLLAGLRPSAVVGAAADGVRAAYHQAGTERPPAGDLDSTLTQLDFLAFLGLPEGALTEARRGLLEGAGKQP